MLRPRSIVEGAKRGEEMGFDRNSGMFLQAIRVLCSMSLENRELKLELFRELGFSDSDILEVFKRAPHVFCASEKKIKEIMNLLRTYENADVSCVVRFPRVLVYSVEQRLKPRLEVLEIPEKKNLLRYRPSSITTFRAFHKKFLEKFILPYSNELGEDYVAKWLL